MGSGVVIEMKIHAVTVVSGTNRLHYICKHSRWDEYHRLSVLPHHSEPVLLLKNTQMGGTLTVGKGRPLSKMECINMFKPTKAVHTEEQF